MSGYDVLVAFLIALCGCGLYLFWGRLRYFPDRTIRDVPAFLRTVDSDYMLKMLDPQTETLLQVSLTRHALRLEQLRNLHYAREYMARMAHNASVFMEWANSELSREIVGRPGNCETEDYLEGARKLQLAASEFRIYALLSLLRINLWILFRTAPWLPFSAPTIADLREIYGFKFFALHSRLTGAVSELGLLYGNEFQHELLKAV